MNTDQLQKLTDSIALLRVPGVGRGRFTALVNTLGSPGDVLSASIQRISQVNGVSDITAKAIISQVDRDSAQRTAAAIDRLGWTFLYPGHPEYPAPLGTIADSPPILFRIGKPWHGTDKMIAIVGTRHPSERGRRFAAALAADLCTQGVVVVSGMAEGIDAAAHAGALDVNGHTIAVWGTPLNRVYPSVHRELAEKLANQGAIYSEYFPDQEVDPAFFPERNRIISGLSLGVVVVEAGRKSGALITASHALDQGRELFAVPGFPDSEPSLGTNALIKQGARLLTSAADIFEELPQLKPGVPKAKSPDLSQLTDTERGIVEQLTAGPNQLDQLARACKLPVSELMEYLLALELKGIIQELAGKRYALVE